MSSASDVVYDDEDGCSRTNQVRVSAKKERNRVAALLDRLSSRFGTKDKDSEFERAVFFESHHDSIFERIERETVQHHNDTCPNCKLGRATRRATRRMSMPETISEQVHSVLLDQVHGRDLMGA